MKVSGAQCQVSRSNLPWLNWMITGDLMSLAASKTALMVEVEVQLKAGKAICKIGCKMRVQIFKIVQIFKKNCLDLGHCTWLSRQYSISFMRLSPVTTPAGTISIKPILRWKSIKRKIFREIEFLQLLSRAVQSLWLKLEL